MALLARKNQASERAKQAADEARALEEELERQQERLQRKRGVAPGSGQHKRVKVEQKPHVIPASIVGQTFDLTDD